MACRYQKIIIPRQSDGQRIEIQYSGERYIFRTMALLAAEHPHAIAAPHKTAAAIMNMKPRNIEALLYVGLIYAPEGCRCAAIAKNIQ